MNQNARLNGAIYLAGFCLEILLKRQLILRHPDLALATCQNESRRKIHRLVWQSHNLEAMIGYLPTLEDALVIASRREGVRYDTMLKTVCAEWSIYLRYSTYGISRADAITLIEYIRALKEILK